MEIQIIQNKIYEIRGVKVMLDFDLAEMYGVETRRLNEQVKRNIERFDDDFMFQLTKEESQILMSQFATSRWGGTRKQPYAFTELGVSMLSSVLKSKAAIEVNKNIMRAFVYTRQYILNSPPTDSIKEVRSEIGQLREYIEEVFADYNEINEDTRMQMELINQALADLQIMKPHPERTPIGYVASRDR